MDLIAVWVCFQLVKVAVLVVVLLAHNPTK
jgi:hypothetical protein